MCDPLYLPKEGGRFCFRRKNISGYGDTIYTEESGLFSVKITLIRVVIHTENLDIKVEIQ